MPGYPCCCEEEEDVELQDCDDVETWAATLSQFEVSGVLFSYNGSGCGVANDCAHDFGALILTAGSNPFAGVTCSSGQQCFYYKLPTSLLICNKTNPQGQDDYLDGFVATVFCDESFPPPDIQIAFQPVISAAVGNAQEIAFDGWIRSTPLQVNTSTQYSGSMSATGSDLSGCVKVSTVSYTMF